MSRFFVGLFRAGDADGVAKAIVDGIEDPDTRGTVLADNQDYLDPPGPRSAWAASQLALARVILQRPDVRASIAKYGHVYSYPVTDH
jgi:hypothetical protein